MKNKLLGLGVALGVICLTACTGGTFLHEYQDVDLWGWSDDDTITFRLPIITSSSTVAAEIGARYTNTYDFTELIVLGIVECDEQVVQTDTIRIPILRENGANEGEGFPYTTTMHPADTFQVDSGHTYSYKVKHLLPTPIRGITGIGLRLRGK